MPSHPLAEVFGFPTSNLSPAAERCRKLRLCPYNNRVPNCTKDKANDPLGVCSIFEGEEDIAIVCPIRFRQDWLIAEDAAAFFFDSGANWTSLTEVRLRDRLGESAGNIDIVLVAYDNHGRVIDFGSLEVQAVYISGNIRRPFEHYIEDPGTRHEMDWAQRVNYPRPDYLSSSRKRLVPQLIYKGTILRSWAKKQAVAIHRGFYRTLPELEEVHESEADMAWMIYDLALDEAQNRYQLTLHRMVYTLFRPALDRITTPDPGPIESFIEHLQEKLDEKLEDEQNPPDAPTLDELL
jgi:hypothetical protein